MIYSKRHTCPICNEDSAEKHLVNLERTVIITPKTIVSIPVEGDTVISN